MQIRLETRETAVRLVLSGRLDASWADHLVETVASQVREGRHAVELELSEVEFLSSAGIRALLRAQRQVAGVRGSYALLSPGELVRSVLKTAGLLSLVMSADAPAAPAAQAVAHRGANCDWSGRWNPSARAARIVAHGDPGQFEADTRFIACGADDLVVGIGALGEDGLAALRAGELLAAAGVVAALPTDGARLPDYLASSDDAQTGAMLLHGLHARGGEAQALRFEARDGGAAELSEVLSSLLDIAGCEAVACALLAECGELSGAAWLSSPRKAGAAPYAWPRVRDHISCTTEPCGERRTVLLTAFAARRGSTTASRLAPQLRAHGPDGVEAHAHALVFPYRALPRRQEGLRSAIDEQFAASQPLALMHLLHDDRPDGLGESKLLRGTAWLVRVGTEAVR